jgi:hypothetical protein
LQEDNYRIEVRGLAEWDKFFARIPNECASSVIKLKETRNSSGTSSQILNKVNRE